MNTSFKANAAQHKAFISFVKETFCATTLSQLRDSLAHHNHNWAINDVITFPSFEGTGKYFVVKASDLLVSVDEAALTKAPARNSIGSLTEVDSPDDACDTDNSLDENWWQSDTFCYSDAIINTCENLAKAILDKCSANNLPIPTSIDEVNRFVDSTSIESFQATMIYPYWTVYTIDNVQHKVFTCSNTEECLIGIIQSVAKDSSVDNDNSLDDDSHLFYADNTVLVSADDTEESFKADWLTNRQHEDALQAAKILFHYWALSGNSLPLPNNWGSLKAFIKSIGAKTAFYIYSCPAREESIGSTALVIDDKLFFLWENTVVSQDLFFETLDNHNYSVQSWFTQKDISVYQQNYQAIVADCEAIIALHEQAYKNADNGIGEYIAFPANINDLHSLVEYLNGTEAADEVVNSIKDEEYLFFQVLSTMNFINSTASTVEA